jgi:hypothetical protein
VVHSKPRFEGLDFKETSADLENDVRYKYLKEKKDLTLY